MATISATRFDKPQLIEALNGTIRELKQLYETELREEMSAYRSSECDATYVSPSQKVLQKIDAIYQRIMELSQ